jgi:hypothetical protein
VRRSSENHSPGEDLDRIRFLADLCHNLPGIARARLQVARATERDTYLWGQDHEDSCDPQLCGYVPSPDS